MDIFGIKNVTENELNFNYDKYYKELVLKLKYSKTNLEKQELKDLSKEYLNNFLNNIQIDMSKLKNNFINLLQDKNSAKYLWILLSKSDNNENYIDKISNILKKENQVIRGGTNSYKLNGWMTHTLYVYQIVNYNIANNIEILNFNGNQDIFNQVKELHQLYQSLSPDSKFILKIFALIHDIGVIEDVTYHDKLGAKYVESVLNEIGLTQNFLDNSNLSINLQNLILIEKELIKYHTLITLLSSESSDTNVKEEYNNLLKSIPDVLNIKYEIPKILILLAYADVIGVDESLMNTEKYNRIQDCYYFFNQITKGKLPERNIEKVAIERICDTTGEQYQSLNSNFDSIIEFYKINKTQFINDMYNIKRLKFAGPLMKTLNDSSLTIKIYYELFELIGSFDGKNELENYTIIFIPDKHETNFVEQFKNGNFFECIKKMITLKKTNFSNQNINILIEENQDGKFVYIRVI